MVYITGDTHAEFYRFGTKQFPEQKELTRDDFVIVCGDFGGIWHSYPEMCGGYSYDIDGRFNSETWWLDWFEEKKFTLLFVDGNHENFDRLYSDEFPIVNFYGGKAHMIRENVYHLMRGYVFDLCGKKFFAFGGASSHDIQDGILDFKNYKSTSDLIKDYKHRTSIGQYVRINHLSWWKQELPTKAEMNRGIKNLEKVNWKVDYVISHSLPTRVVQLIYKPKSESDVITEYFDELLKRGLTFDEWHCGHYHREFELLKDYHIHYHDIVKLF